MLANRLVSHLAVACCRATLAGSSAITHQLRAASAAAAPASEDQAAASLPSLTPEQRQQLPKLLAALRAPGDTAALLAATAHLATSFRDLSITLTALQSRQYGLDPLLDDPSTLAARIAGAAAAEAHRVAARKAMAEAIASDDKLGPAAAAAASEEVTDVQPRQGSYLPYKDVSLLPDDVAVDGVSKAPAAPQYREVHMDKVSCWSALQPNHIESSQALLAGIKLFPAQEAAYPTYVDFDAALRMLSHRTSRKRMNLKRRLARKQDKYQLKTWDHSPGEA